MFVLLFVRVKIALREKGAAVESRAIEFESRSKKKYCDDIGIHVLGLGYDCSYFARIRALLVGRVYCRNYIVVSSSRLNAGIFVTRAA